jgi:hypothetical protein
MAVGACRTRVPVGRSPPRGRVTSAQVGPKHPVVLSARVDQWLPVDLGSRVGLRTMDLARRRVTRPVDGRAATRPARDRVPHGKAMWPADNSLRGRALSSRGVGQGSHPVGRGRERDSRAALLVLNNLQVARAMRLVPNRIRTRVGHGPRAPPAGPVRRWVADRKRDEDRAVDPRRGSGRAVVPVRTSQVGRKRDAHRAGRVRSKQAGRAAARVSSKQVDRKRGAGRSAWARSKRGAGPVLSKAVDRTRGTDRPVAQVRSRQVDPVSRVEMPVRPVLGLRAGRAIRVAVHSPPDRLAIRESADPVVARLPPGGKETCPRVRTADLVSKGRNRIQLTVGRPWPDCRRGCLAKVGATERMFRAQRLGTSGVPISPDRTRRRPRCRFPGGIRWRGTRDRRMTAQ